MQYPDQPLSLLSADGAGGGPMVNASKQTDAVGGAKTAGKETEIPTRAQAWGLFKLLGRAGGGGRWGPQNRRTAVAGFADCRTGKRADLSRRGRGGARSGGDLNGLAGDCRNPEDFGF